MASYTDADAVAAYLGTTFSPEQAAQAEALAASATAYIDRYTGRTWQGTSPVAGELANVLPGAAWSGAVGLVYLAHRPVEAVSAVALRSAEPHDEAATLDAADFELLDPVAGAVSLRGGYPYWPYPGLLAVVDYTYTDPVPPDVTLAATMIAAGEMSKLLAIQRGQGVIDSNPSLAGLSEISVGQNDVSVKLGSTVTGGAASASSAAGSNWAAPGSAVAGILDGYVRVVFA